MTYTPYIYKKNIAEEVDLNDVLKLRSRLDGSLVNLNSTGRFIYENCDAVNSINDIIEKFGIAYNIDYETAYEDVEGMLLNLWEKGFLRWKGASPYFKKYTNVIDGNMLTEVTFDTVDNFLVKEELEVNYFNPYLNKGSVSLDLLQVSILIKNGFIYEVKNEKEDVLKLFTSFNPSDFVLEFQIMQVKGEIDLSLFELLIQKIVKEIKSNVSVPEGCKAYFKAYISGHDTQLRQFLFDTNFNNVGMLEKETIKGDLEVYIKEVEI